MGRLDKVMGLSARCTGVLGLLTACGVSSPPVTAPTVVLLDNRPLAGGPVAAPIEPAAPVKLVLDAPPTDIAHAVDINFENRLHVIGYRFEPEIARAGQEVELTFWWRCDAPLDDDGWHLFTHTRDEATGKMDNLDYVGPLRALHGDPDLSPHHWEKGKFYVDPQSYTVPADVKGPVTVMLGVWKDDARLRVIVGPNDGDNAAILGKIQIRP